MKLKIVDVLLILIGLVILYQLIKKIFLGSWQTESLIIALLIFNLGMTWKLSIKFEGHLGWHKAKD